MSRAQPRWDSLDLRHVTMAVLDEADRMLDMGFAEDVASILATLPNGRQTALFSATFPPSLSNLTADVLRDPLWLTLDPQASDEPDIHESAWRVPEAEKFGALVRVLSGAPYERALIFTNFKRVAKELAAALATLGASARAIHGDLEQSARDEELIRFRNRSTVILVATDVAARGLDVTGLDLVVNYDLPTRRDSYVHRVGRTGRAGHSGVAISLVTPADEPLLQAIEAHTGKGIVRVEVPGEGEPEIHQQVRRSAPMCTLRIQGGRRDKLRPGDIVGALTGDAGGLTGEDIGDIVIADATTYVAIRACCADRALRGLQRGRIKAKRFRVLRL